jgi:rfaE bifunctional protein nucleotidyltransferase chain/domain
MPDREEMKEPPRASATVEIDQTLTDVPASRSTRSKLQSMADLGAVAASERAAGKRVVLCHGVFDVLHLGHIRHLKLAREEGDVLIVTLTADQYVNKGPGRPIFTEHMRAEMISVLEYVDWVAVNHAPTALTAIEAVQPDIYVKGSDYENPEEDVTGKIREERSAVESYGGMVVFTRDVTFSSSNLINKYFDIYDPPLREYLDRQRGAKVLAPAIDLIESVRDMSVLLVGDTIIDEYRYVIPLGKAAKENIITTLGRDTETFAGGIIAAANDVASFCKHVEVITTLGNDEYAEFVRASVKPNVTLTTVSLDRPTTRKTRFVDRGASLRKLFEVYTMDDAPSDALDDFVRARARHHDVTIVTDFGHGAIVPSTVDALVQNSRFLAVNTQTNSGNAGFNFITKYPRADYICIDAPEARFAMVDRYNDLETIAERYLPERVPCKNIMITHGAAGSVAHNPREGTFRVPAFTKTVVDTVGAGDALFAITAPMVAAGGAMEKIGLIGNAVGAMKVGIVGHRSAIDKVSLIKYLTSLLK